MILDKKMLWPVFQTQSSIFVHSLIDSSAVPKYVLCQEETFNKWVIDIFESSEIYPSQSAECQLFKYCLLL